MSAEAAVWVLGVMDRAYWQAVLVGAVVLMAAWFAVWWAVWRWPQQVLPGGEPADEPAIEVPKPRLRRRRARAARCALCNGGAPAENPDAIVDLLRGDKPYVVAKKEPKAKPTATSAKPAPAKSEQAEFIGPPVATGAST